MSAISPNPFATGFSTVALNFDFEHQGISLSAALTPAYRERSDAIRSGQNGFFSSAPTPANDGFGGETGYQSEGANGGQSQFMSIITALFGSISSLFAQLGSMIGSGGRISPEPTPSGRGEHRFGHATASSVGDPHESFHGTTSGGKTIDDHWDSMTSHDNLLSSNSFDGGYRIATAVTQPGSSGVTTNDRVTVATNGGNTNVTMKKDGSYDVSAFGHHIDLEVGKATHINDGETVTKNADGSLTIDDINGRGGKVETTLRGTGGGVDVNATADDVDLGGYLVAKNDGDVDPVALAGRDGYGSSYTVPPVAFAPSSFPEYDPMGNDRTQLSQTRANVAQAYAPDEELEA